MVTRWEVSGFIQGWGMHGESRISSFFLMLIKGKGQDGFKVFYVAPEMETLLTSSTSL